MNSLNPKTKSLLFYGACIPVRLVIAYIAYIAAKKNALLWKLFAAVLLIIGINMAYLYFSNTRLNAPEGGGVTWWAKYRLIHAVLYITAAVYVAQGNDKAWVPLVIDAIFGLGLKIIHT